MTCCLPDSPRAGGTHADHLHLGRRRFLKIASLGAGVAVFLGAAPRLALASGKADALVLTCMDYRLADDVHSFLDAKGMQDRYDHVVLAGASAGVIHPMFADWRKTFWDHLSVSVDLHAIHKVMVIDHRDCGAYKLALESDLAAEPARELAVHAKMLAALAAEIRLHAPKLEVEGYLMALDGSVEQVDLGLA